MLGKNFGDHIIVKKIDFLEFLFVLHGIKWKIMQWCHNTWKFAYPSGQKKSSDRVMVKTIVCYVVDG
jgi:hypothetical protein